MVVVMIACLLVSPFVIIIFVLLDFISITIKLDCVDINSEADCIVTLFMWVIICKG